MVISKYLSNRQIFMEGHLYAKHSAKLWSYIIVSLNRHSPCFPGVYDFSEGDKESKNNV